MEEALGRGRGDAWRWPPRRASGPRRARRRRALGAGRARRRGAPRGRRRLLASLSEAGDEPGRAGARAPAGFEEQRLYRGVPLVVIAAGLQNPGNLGGLLRSAEAAGATGAYLTEGSADPFSWKALRGSMGSAFRLPHVRGLSARDALERVRAPRPPGGRHRSPRRAGLRRGGLARARRASSSAPRAPAWRRTLAASADRRVPCPMRAPVESLNVGVAAGILLFEAARQRRRGTRLRLQSRGRPPRLSSWPSGPTVPTRARACSSANAGRRRGPAPGRAAGRPHAAAHARRAAGPGRGAGPGQAAAARDRVGRAALADPVGPAGLGQDDAGPRHPPPHARTTSRR